MSKPYKFSVDELASIDKLPAEFLDLAERYPIDLVNAGDFHECPPLPDGYIPEIIEIYYADTNNPDLLVVNGELRYFVTVQEGNYPLIAVQIDGDWAYIEIEERIVLDRLGGVILPDLIVEPSIFMGQILKKEGTGNREQGTG